MALAAPAPGLGDVADAMSCAQTQGGITASSSSEGMSERTLKMSRFGR